MADNVAFSGETTAPFTAAADEIAGVKHQRVKVEIGVDGVAADVHTGNPMPVAVQTVVKGATAAGTVTSTTASADRQPLDVTLRDTSGNPVSVGGGTQYDEDAASAGGEKLTMAGFVRKDTPAAATSANGDYATGIVDNENKIWMNLGDLSVALQFLALDGTELDRILTAPGRRDDAFQATITSADATTAVAVKTATAAKKIYVTELIISVGAAMAVRLQDSAPLVLMNDIYLPANSVFSKTFATPLMVGTNLPLNVKASVAGNISVTALGYVI